MDDRRSAPARPSGRGRHTDVVVVGAGHSGLAMSALLAGRGIDHVVLERGEAGHAWRTERWDSLRLLTPNWMCRLPGMAYDGDDPHGYMGAAQVAALVARYAAELHAPVHPCTTVRRVSARGNGYQVHTDQGDWHCRVVVLASGACRRAWIPPIADRVPASVQQCSVHAYRRPTDLAPGAVLVVGASASGLQLAQELRASGRRVLLACGEHVRMPRRYRGHDVQWWLLASGVLDQRIDQVDDPVRARALPSPQLSGGHPPATLDLNAVQRQGVELCGRLVGVAGTRAQFAGALAHVCALADLKMNRMLGGFDAWAADAGIDGELVPVERFAATQLPMRPRLQVQLGDEIRSIVWATGYRADFDWLDLPVFDRRGALRHDRGVVDAPGLYVLGLPFMRRRKSSFIHGAEDDARELLQHLLAHLDHRTGTEAHNAAASAAAQADHAVTARATGVRPGPSPMRAGALVDRWRWG